MFVIQSYYSIRKMLHRVRNRPSNIRHNLKNALKSCLDSLAVVNKWIYEKLKHIIAKLRLQQSNCAKNIRENLNQICRDLLPVLIADCCVGLPSAS